MPDRPVIAVVMHDPDARARVAALVRTRGHFTEEFATVDEFFDRVQPNQIQQRHVSCVVAETKLPESGPLQLQRRLAEARLHAPVVFLCGYESAPRGVTVIKAGAATVPATPASDDALLGLIEGTVQQAAQAASAAAQRTELARRLTLLSAEENAVLTRVLEGESNKQIAAHEEIGLRTVELRRSSIMRKMQAESLAHLVRLVMTAQLGENGSF